VIDEMEQLEQMCAAVPAPDRQRLTAARARLGTAIGRETAGHTARRPRLARSLALRRRWLGWAAPLAAAVAVTGVILGSQGAFSTLHRPAPNSNAHDPGLGLAHPATAYVAGQSGTATAILTATGTALKPIRIGNDHEQISSAIVFRPDGKTAYVLSSTILGGGLGTVTPIRTATNTALKPITVGQDPRAMAITPDGTTIYVTNYQSGTVTPIRTATGTALAPIRVGGNPWAIAITPDGKTAYVANTQPGTVTPISTATNTALAPIRVGRYPLTIAITPDGRTAYVLNNGSGTVTPIRTATGTALAPITVPAGSFSMEMTPDGTTIYVLDLGSSQDQEGMVVPIRTATNTALRPIPIGHAWPSTISIAITPDSRTAYVANAGTDTVIPIRTATDTALAPIRLADGAGPIAITPDGRTAYVIEGSGPGRTGTVIAIRTATNQVLRAITVGDLPSVIAITPAPRPAPARARHGD
jgi:YVTN family beta-propeller protein